MNQPDIKIAPSVLSGDFSRLGQECERMLGCGADYLHMDIMDGHFVPNLTIGPPIIKSVRKHTTAFLDCHLMVTAPEMWVRPMAEAGASLFTFHIEAASSPKDLVSDIKSSNMLAGVALKPSTPIAAIEEIAASVDMVLIMSVEPGFGGQAFMPDVLDKISMLRSKFPLLDIEVDGGINLDNIESVVKAGANIIVAGSSIFNSPDPAETIRKMKSAAPK